MKHIHSVRSLVSLLLALLLFITAIPAAVADDGKIAYKQPATKESMAATPDAMIDMSELYLCIGEEDYLSYTDPYYEPYYVRYSRNLYVEVYEGDSIYEMEVYVMGLYGGEGYIDVYSYEGYFLSELPVYVFYNHDIVTEYGYPATCTQDGLTDGSYCDLCYQTIVEQEVIPALGHNSVVTTPAKSPTCTTNGNTEGTSCSRCNIVITAPTTIPAAHSYGAPKVIREPVRNNPGQQEYTCTVCNATKKEDIIVKATSVTFEYNWYEMYAHKDKNNRDSMTLEATIYPDNVSNDKLTWSSKDNSIATVNTNGVVTAKSEGTTVIYAKAADGSNVYARCEVDVLKDTKAKLKKLTADTKKLTIKKGETYPVKLTFKPAKVFNNTVTWTTSNKKIATVDKKGVITAKKKGTCTITATSKLDKSKKVTITVKVKK